MVCNDKEATCERVAAEINAGGGRAIPFIADIPARRIGTPLDIAKVIVFMVSDDAGYIHGQTLLVDG